MKTQRLAEDRLYGALRAINMPSRDRIVLDDPALQRQQMFKRLFTGLKRA
jgi:hypothetical protein